jgi:hypothetical protein
MPRKPIHEIPDAINRRGRPVGSTNKFPMLLRQLVLNAADMSGFPKEKWIIEPALDDEGNTIWVEATDPKTGEIKKDKNGNVKYRQKMRRRRVLEWTGAMGVQGYLLFMAQEERNLFSKMLTLAQQQQENRSDAPEGLQLPTLEQLRDEWIRRGLKPVDFDKMKTVKAIEAKQRVRLIEHDPNERMRVRNGSKQQSREAASTTDPEAGQWWPDEEEDGDDED